MLGTQNMVPLVYTGLDIPSEETANEQIKQAIKLDN